MLDFANYKCERCGVNENVVEDKMLTVYRARLCLKCWRAWEYLLLENPDYKAMKAVGQKYVNADEKEKQELVKLSESIVRELYPVLEQWISKKE